MSQVCARPQARKRTRAVNPGKRHWLKIKRDYLADGAMADSADLVVLGAYMGAYGLLATVAFSALCLVLCAHWCAWRAGARTALVRVRNSAQVPGRRAASCRYFLWGASMRRRAFGRRCNAFCVRCRMSVDARPTGVQMREWAR